MNNTFCLVPIFSLILAGAAAAAPLKAQEVNNAAIKTVSTDRLANSRSKFDPAIVHLQVLLDRAGSSPGVIDGHDGENLRKAIAGFELTQHLPVDGKLDPDVIGRLPDDAPAIQPYVISEDDGKDLVEKIPKDYAEQAKMHHLGYTSIAEKLAERFHMDINLFKALNPNAPIAVGETVSVAMPGAARSGEAKRIEAHKKSGQVLAFAEDGTLLAAYPATIGSEESPSPTGTHKVKGVARMPTYTYNPKVNFQQGKNRTILKLSSGPNNPVGTAWIDLTQPTYGIHGTPNPELIGKAGSHGCVRLTNWDVEELVGMVKPGVVVEFFD
ncbi:L,D-transpeptidase [Rhizobium sp. R693]|uniref:L,D-transpeptidase family protein n=1 Tax=Rhizobium sp. R693 TaxID=1764276 RepID=UPI000B5363F2|nr:L,D-transpeptidase [Rhizobium sp. R693]OWV97260.1 hypothetical protein ATY79_22500 [Rhizobium sp. R693]